MKYSIVKNVLFDSIVEQIRETHRTSYVVPVRTELLSLSLDPCYEYFHEENILPGKEKESFKQAVNFKLAAFVGVFCYKLPPSQTRTNHRQTLPADDVRLLDNAQMAVLHRFIRIANNVAH